MSDYQMIIHTDADSAIGHAMVELRGPNGERRMVGFNPADSVSRLRSADPRGVAGKVKKEDERMGKHSKSIKSSVPIPLSPEGHASVSRFLDDAEHGKGGWDRYDINDRNCVDFANASLQAGGKKGDVDDYLSPEQRKQMTSAMTYSAWKYGKDRKKREVEADTEGSAVIGAEIGGWPGEETAPGKAPKPDPADTTAPMRGKAAGDGAGAEGPRARRAPDWFSRRTVGGPVMGRLAHARTLDAEAAKARTATPPSASYGLAEAVHGKPFDKVVKTKRGDIPLDDPSLLHDQDVKALMTSKPYRDGKHPLSGDTQKTVKSWFDAAYPGKAKTDASGRLLAVPRVERPAGAPDAVKRRPHGPLRAPSAAPAGAVPPTPAPEPKSSGPSAAEREAAKRADRLARAKAVQKGVDAHYARIEKRNAVLRRAETGASGYVSGTSSGPAVPAPAAKAVVPPRPPVAPPPVRPASPQSGIKAPPPVPAIGSAPSAPRNAPSFGGAFSYGGVNGAGGMASQVPAAPAAPGTSGTDAASPGGAATATAAARVICTELTGRKLMDPALYFLDVRFTERHIAPATVRGYHLWAVPYVRLMRRPDRWGRLAVRLARPPAQWRAEEVAYRLGERPAGNWKGKLVRWIGEPLCTAIGLFAPSTDPLVLYETEV